MSEFGSLLRTTRQQSKDAKLGRILSQERLGQLIGIELGSGAFSASVISDWERGTSKIQASDRLVLISLLKVLHQYNGIKTPEEANKLLEAGNYRALDSVERRLIFPENAINSIIQIPSNKLTDTQKIVNLLLERIFSIADNELPIFIAKAEEGPPPVWPRILVALLRRLAQRLTPSRILKILFWIWLWVIAYKLISPSLNWSFISQENVVLSTTLYSTGSLVIPLIIGAITNTRNNRYLQRNNPSSYFVTRLFTHQGAFVGFHLGYFFILIIQLFFYYLHFDIPFWFQFVLVGILLFISYASAQLVPFNLLYAYGRLNLADGGIFFLFLILGPLWGLFFTNYYEFLLNYTLGPVIILLLTTLLVTRSALQYRKTKTDKNIPDEKEEDILKQIQEDVSELLKKKVR